MLQYKVFKATKMAKFAAGGAKYVLAMYSSLFTLCACKIYVQTCTSDLHCTHGTTIIIST